MNTEPKPTEKHGSNFFDSLQSTDRDIRIMRLAGFRSSNQRGKMHLLKLLITRNSEGSSEPFVDGTINESNPFNQVGIAALGCVGNPIVAKYGHNPTKLGLTFKDMIGTDRIILDKMMQLK
jgi:hypothetical protein